MFLQLRSLSEAISDPLTNAYLCFRMIWGALNNVSFCVLLKKYLRIMFFRYLSWESGWFCKKRGKTCVGMTIFSFCIHHHLHFINNFSLVPLEKVLQFFPGQTTSQFQRWSSIYGEAKDTSFSIIYSDGNGNEVSSLINRINKI